MNIKTIIKLMDFKTLVAGVVPVVIGSLYSLYEYQKINLLYLFLLSISMILIQSATNMINDYFDFKRGADSYEKAEEKALVNGEVTPKQVMIIIFIYMLSAVLIGIYIANQTSYSILAVGLLGISISVLYAFGPLPISYTPIGEIIAGLTMGVGITSTVIYIQSSVFNINTILVAIPTSFFIGTILLSNNISDIISDKEAGRKTLPVLIGIENTEKLWVINVLMLLILTAILVLMGIYPLSTLIAVILLFPYKSIRVFLSYKKSIQTKDKTMGLIGKIGIKYHTAVLIGLSVSIIFN